MTVARDENGDRFGLVLGYSSAMREIFALLRRVSASNLSVLIEGDTGTGKEAVARSIHMASDRSEQPFVVLDCSAIPRELIESTLFGHERGAFTGAIGQQKGVFEQANGGTLFLDEMGELDLGMQPKLLRALETGEIRRVGGQVDLPVDVRIVAATNRDLRSMVLTTEFREDLYYRLAVVRVPLPPLRSRRSDIELLVTEFVEQLNVQRTNREMSPVSFGPDFLSALEARAWPGNIRQLKNVVERAASLADSTTLGVDDLEPEWTTGSHSVPTVLGGLDSDDEWIHYEVDSSRPFKTAKAELLSMFETTYLSALMQVHDNNISKAARASGLTRFYLRELLKKRGMHGED